MASLKKYQQKRIFNKTIEPKGKMQRKIKNKSARFVVQKHQASHLHFDFRLESEGVLKSWAVPKGIPFEGEKHLAMMVEDHPLEYQNFEGIIPPGNYGAGKVIVWDHGEYLLKDQTDNSQLPYKIEKGEFGFSLQGEKIRGEFSMVRLKKAQENAWLLIARKVEDKDKLNDDRSVVSGLSIEEVGKDEFEIEKYPEAEKSLMPDFISPMLATLIDEPFDDADWLYEIKWDGYRIIAKKHEKEVELFSRNKKNFNEIFFPIVESLKKIQSDFVLDGEVVAVDEKGASNFQLLQNYLTTRKGKLIYYVFDIVHLNGYDLKNILLSKRREILENLLKEQEVQNIRISEAIEKDGIALFETASKHGIEGIIAKKKNSKYRENFRTSQWVKIKTFLSQDAIICGFTQPRGSRKKFGALILGVYEKNKLVYIGHVGGGFDEKGLSMMMGKLESLISDECPFDEVPKTNTVATWVKPKLVCNVRFSEWTEDGIMRQPIFLGMRLDKNPQDVQREFSLEKKILISPKRKKYSVENQKVEEIISGQNLVLANLQKIYWPQEGYTKGDLIEYYKKISKYILPYIKNRPQSLNRFPDGIHGKSFFQKDMPLAPSWIKKIKIFSPTEEKEIEYMICNDKAALIYMINLGCIEINVWNSSIEKLEYPDYMVLDIDPQNLPFSFAVKVALEAKKILDEISIEGFCKTSGSRGLHIYVPMGARYTHEQVREFSRLLNLIINSRLPKITSMQRDPNVRDKKVYLDYLQNRWGQTMAAAYCVRPRVGAPVSTPLEWKELNEKLNPQEFNIKTIFSRLQEKGDIWEDIFKNRKNDLGTAVILLEKVISSQRNKSKTKM